MRNNAFLRKQAEHDRYVAQMLEWFEDQIGTDKGSKFMELLYETTGEIVRRDPRKFDKTDDIITHALATLARYAVNDLGMRLYEQRIRDMEAEQWDERG